MKAIGFANKYYTLWEIAEEHKPLGNGHSYVVTHYNYIQNISIDKNVAFAKCPGLQFDENLRGHYRSWETKKEVWDNVDTFRFGKYSGTKIDNSDLSYLEWYWDNVYDNDHKAYVEKVLVDNGYEVRTWGGDNKYLMSPEALENEKAERQHIETMIEKLKTSNTIDVVITNNPDEDGICIEGGVYYVFPEVKENYYNGFFYYLPVLNGKAKRVKNKTIEITDFEYTVENDNLYIKIKNFNIKKNI